MQEQLHKKDALLYTYTNTEEIITQVAVNKIITKQN
jgi:hypothetical protein